MGIRLRAGFAPTVRVESISIQALANGQFEWLIVWNPTIAGGGLTWSDVTNFGVQQGLPDLVGNPSVTTITGGVPMRGGYGTSDATIQIDIRDVLTLGRLIAGTPDTIVLCARALTNNADIRGGMTFRELN